MGKFEPFEEGVEVNGQTVLSLAEGVPDPFRERALEILADNGIEDPQPGQWYPQEAWLGAFEDVWSDVGEATLRGIGRSIPENADWPADVDTIAGGLATIDEAYHLNHRGGEIGYYRAERLDDGRVEVRCKNPYPCAFDRGIVKGVAETFAEESFPRLTEKSTRCRDDGGVECVYDVEL